MKKRIMAMALAAALLMPLGVSAEEGSLYYTDIKTYIYYSPITSYNVGGRTVIDAEILNWHYGFDVYWYAEERRLEITDKGGSFNSLQAMSGELVESADGPVGEPFRPYYKTDIVTTLNGTPIESYNIGGRTFIVAEAMRDFGYNVTWQEESRTLTITKPMNFYEIETDYGTLKSAYKPFAYTSLPLYERGILVQQEGGRENGEEVELKTPSNLIISGAGVGDTYLPLSDALYLLGAECELVEEVTVSRSEWVNGISYDEEHYAYYLDITYDPAVSPEESPAPTEQIRSEKVLQEVYGFPLSIRVNGGEVESLWKYNPKIGDVGADAIVADGEIWLPVYTAAKLLGYGYGW